jgi:hypothetical protein
MIVSSAFSFSTLNFWRKLWVVLVGIVNGGIGVALLLAPFIASEPPPASVQPVIFFVGVLSLFVAWWTYYAVSRRRVGHLVAIAITNLLATNIIGALITLSVIRVTKVELSASANGSA